MRRLILVTGTFPYGTGETFLEAEIPFLVHEFDEVDIFPALVKRDDKHDLRVLPEGVRVFTKEFLNEKQIKPPLILSEKEVWREIRKHCLGRNMLKRMVSCYRFEKMVNEATATLGDFIKRSRINSRDDVIIYSYWLSTIGMTALRIRDALTRVDVRAKVVARTHGFDLYAERAHIGYLPFQEQMLAEMDSVFPCSRQGEHYLKTKYPQLSDKIRAKYLGVPDRFDGALPRRTKTFSIVSCSSIIPVKRVGIIAEALTKITVFDIKWTHFGDGELFEELKSRVKTSMPSNVHVNLMGHVPNESILDYYACHNINLFVSVSESEGLPVSIMEACSFGIPIIATDVGGTSEIVEDGTNGHLLPRDFEVQQLVHTIIKVEAMDSESYRTMCQASRDMYLSKFSAEKNYTAFCYELVRIAEEA